MQRRVLESAKGHVRGGRVPSVLHITEALGGGVQSALVNYARALPEYMHAVVARERPSQGTYAWPENTTLTMIDGTKLGFLRKAASVARASDAELIHLHSSYAGVLRALIPASIPIAYSPHCYAMERLDMGNTAIKLIDLTETLLTRCRTQAIVAVSAHEATIASRLHRTTPVYIVPNPPPRLEGNIRGHDANNPSGRFQICAVGRLCPQKDPDFFAEAYKMLSEDGVRAVWVGDGDIKLRAQLERAGVEVTGWIDPQSAREVVASSSLYVHTARWEGAPISAIEAAHAGVPVLSRSIPSMSSLGYALLGTSPLEMRDSVLRFRNDDAYSQYVRERTRSVMESNNWQLMAEGLRCAYLQLTGREAMETDRTATANGK